MIWLLFLFMSIVAVAFMAGPLLLRKRAVVASLDATPAVLLDQLAEVQSDQKRGLISQSEAMAATQEIKRRILLDSRRAVSGVDRSGGEGHTALVLSAFFVPLLAIGYYATMGSPDTASIAFADRVEERTETAELEELTARLHDRLMNDPEGGPSGGWILLGQTYFKMGRFSDAAESFKVVSERPEASSAVFSMLAEALFVADQGIVSPRAQVAINKAVALDPANPAATYYQAIALSQNGELAQAYDLLVSRLNDADGIYPWMETFIEEANRIGTELAKPRLSLESFAPMSGSPGPTGEDIANAQNMTTEDRQAFIASMVDRLADRLQDDPEDLDGWMRLGNAYAVLGEKSQALEAFERADDLLVNMPATDPRQQIVKDALAGMR